MGVCVYLISRTSEILAAVAAAAAESSLAGVDGDGRLSFLESGLFHTPPIAHNRELRVAPAGLPSEKASARAARLEASAS